MNQEVKQITLQSMATSQIILVSRLMLTHPHNFSCSFFYQ